jgi:predicted acetyltransferase
VWPSREYLPGYVDALERGWSPDNLRGVAAAHEELDQIAPMRTRSSRASSTGRRRALQSSCRTVPCLPGYRQWLWDGEFCGSIGFRWQPGTEALPPHCLGHIGYAVVPWKQRRGYATAALRDMIRAAAAEGLRYVELVTEPHNVASQRVIESNGGVLLDHFVKAASLGGVPALRYRIETASTCDMRDGFHT